MARGINKVILIGNLGNDPETRYLPNGNPVASFSLATSETWKDKVSGEKQERTEWHRVVCFNKLGEIAGQYVRKGSRLYIEGSLKTRKWQDQQGVERYTTEIIASELQMLDTKTTGSMPQNNDMMYAGTKEASAPTANHHEVALNELDDDIPF